MGSFRYSLEKYRGKKAQCPECEDRSFSRYVDNETGEILNELVGRCDHERRCGYHYTPRQYFADHPELKDSRSNWNSKNFGSFSPRRTVPASQPLRGRDTGTPANPLCYVPDSFVERSVRLLAYQSQLVLFLQKLIDPLVLECVLAEYKVGVTKSKDVIFYLIDIDGHCRSGKVMRYTPDGRRDKSSNPYWIHTGLKKEGVLPEDWTLTQCLFGEHLLRRYPDKTVAIVESEKTAIVCAAMMPQYLWLATCGKNTGLARKIQVLRGRKVVAFPDLDAHEDWKSLFSEISDVDIQVSDYLLEKAKHESISPNADLADVILAELEKGSL